MTSGAIAFSGDAHNQWAISLPARCSGPIIAVPILHRRAAMLESHDPAEAALLSADRVRAIASVLVVIGLSLGLAPGRPEAALVATPAPGLLAAVAVVEGGR